MGNAVWNYNTGQSTFAVLRENVTRIMEQWMVRVRLEISGARDQEERALAGFFPEFLGKLAVVLSSSEDSAPSRRALQDGCELARRHGLQRADIQGYAMGDVLKEWFILRQVVSALLSTGGPTLSDWRRLLSGMESGMAAASGVFAEQLMGHQEKCAEELRQSEAFLESIIENIPDMIFVKDARTLQFVRINRAAEKILGLGREEMIGKNDYSFFPKEQADFFTSRDRKVIETGEMLEIQEEPISTRHLGRRVLHTKKIPLYDKKGAPLYLLGISEDVTDKKRAERQRIRLNSEKAARTEAEHRKRVLEDALRLRDEFISMASHELRTPLTSLRLQAQMIRRFLEKGDIGSIQSPRMRTLIERTDSEVERLSRLIGDMLDVSRIRLGRLELNKARVSLNAIVEGAVDRVTEAMAESRIVVRVEARSEVWGWWDQYRIEQVVTNLLSNAIKYGAGKPVEILVDATESMACIMVVDQGMGIAGENQDRIFERFQRIGTEKTISGLGIGLFITKQIVLAHGGTIRVESELGQGARFIVELPTHGGSKGDECLATTRSLS